MSRFYLARGPTTTDLDPAQARRLTDQDLTTYLDLPVGAGSALDIRFIGAPRWLNRVVLRVASSDGIDALEVSLLDLYGGWRLFGRQTVAPGQIEAEMDGRDSYVQGIRVSVSAVSGEDGETALRMQDIVATFDQVDPDHGPMLDEVPRLHYDWVNSYPWTNDLSKCDNDARGLRDYLPGSWDYGGHGNSDAHEHHYKRGDVGTGNNEDHLDWSDLSYFSGHGSDNSSDWYWGLTLGSFLFGESVDDRASVPGDARAAWGNNNCEWHGMTSCKTMKAMFWDYWYEAMDGLHLIMGATTNISDKNYGKKFAQRMVDSGIWDSAHSVRSSFFYSLDYHNYNGEAAAIGETEACGSDHLWGQGSVSDDAPHNGWYHWWTHDLYLNAQPERDPVETARLRDPARYNRPATPELLPRTSRKGMSVSIDPALLASPRQGLYCWNVLPFTVDSSYVRAVANSICSTQGFLCGGTIGSTGDGDTNLIIGPHELRTDELTGAYEYVNPEEWLAWKRQRPQLPSPQDAIYRANRIAASWLNFPIDGSLFGVDYVHQGLSQDGGPDDPDSTFAIGIRVLFERRIDGHRVRGGGGKWSATFGEGGKIQRVMNNGWRHITQGSLVEPIDPAIIIDEIRAHGWMAAIDGVRSPADQLTITSIEPGYYEPPIGEPTPMVCPCYIINGLVSEGGGEESPVEFCAWADATMPQGTIISPPDSTVIDPGDRVCFQATGSGGIPPYTFDWLDEAGTRIGHGQSACATLDLPPPVDETPFRMRTIELLILDTAGRMTSSFIRIAFSGESGVDVATRPEGLSLSGGRPNPFAEETTISYAIPSGGETRVQLRIYDAGGRRVRTLVDALQPPNRYSVTWDGKDDRGRPLPGGMYYSRLEVGGQVRTTRMSLLH